MKIIDQLKESLEKTLPYFDLPVEQLNKSYGPGKWNIKQILHHQADADTILYERIRRIIAEPRKVIWAFDQDDWCNNLDYKNVPLLINKDIYTSTRKAVIYYAEQFYNSHGNKEFVHSETGVKTLKDEFDKIAKHNFNHIAQIELALSTQ